MTTTELKGGLVSLQAEEGYLLRRIGAEPHTTITRTTVKADQLAQWEEVPAGQVPVYTKAEYDAKVSEMVRQRYSADEEFAIQRKLIGAMLNPTAMSIGEDDQPSTPGAIEEFNAYNTYVEQCKARAKDHVLYTRTDDTTALLSEDPSSSPNVIQAEASIPDTLDPDSDSPDNAAE